MLPKINFNKVKLIAFTAIITNEISRFMRIWQQTLLPSAITMGLYFLIFGSFIGNRIGSTEGVNYTLFITPGLVMMAIITSSYANVVSSFYGLRFQKSVEELLIAPVPDWLIIAGFTMGGVVRGILNGLIVLFVALFFTHIKLQHFLITLTITLLTSTLFSLAGFTNALIARGFDDTAFVSTFILTPLTYLGGIFYSLQQLPEFWQTLSKFNPILYMVNTFRYGMLGITDVPITSGMIIISLIIVGIFYLNLYLFRKGVGIRT